MWNFLWRVLMIAKYPSIFMACDFGGHDYIYLKKWSCMKFHGATVMRQPKLENHTMRGVIVPHELP